MDQIPPEILANIINCLGGEEKLTPYASVSRQFRSGIERRTFRTLSHLKSTDLDFLSAAFLNHPLRRTYLKFLCLTVVLPPLQACCPVTQIPDRDADSATYSAAVRKLFSILRKIDDVVGDIGQDGLELCFATVDPPSYSSHRIWCRTHNRRDIVGAIARSGRITLAGADELPFLRGVGLFLFMGSHDFSFVEPGVSLEVAGKMPDFSSLVVYLRDSFTLGRVRRIAERQQFVQALRSYRPDHLHNFKIYFPYEQIGNEESKVQQLAPPDKWEQDSVCMMIKCLSTWSLLTRLYLLGGVTLHTHFFKSFHKNSNSFESLEELLVEFSPDTADGRWFLHRDDLAFRDSKTNPKFADFWTEYHEAEEEDRQSQREPNEDEDFCVFEDGPVWTHVVWRHQFRSLPDPDTFLPFLLDCVGALRCLRKLRMFRLKLRTSGVRGETRLDYESLSRVFDVWYLKAGTELKGDWRDRFPKVRCDARYLGRDRLYWRTGTWTPWDEVQEVWREFVGHDAKGCVFQGGRLGLL